MSTHDSRYDSEYIRRRYDLYGEREWGRFLLNPHNRVNFHIHRHYLRQYIRGGDHVLDIGAGPGRFSIELAKIGARVTVGDISPIQLDLNRQKVTEAGCEGSVVSRAVMDIVDLSQIASETFDAVVCYGGPLSYVFDRADTALSELLRVTRSGGYVFVSVMSLLGSFHELLSPVIDIARGGAVASLQRLIETGDQYEDDVSGGHLLHFYRWQELRTLLERHPCTIVAASASNFLSIAHDALLEDVIGEGALWETLLEWEIGFCRQSGALDAGTHIIAVVRRA
jgi:SAM-dependent methyltransferase